MVAGQEASLAQAEHAQPLAELLAERAVDDEVDARIGGDEQVGDVVEVVVGAAAAVVGRLGQPVEEHDVDGGGRLADDERHHDDHRDEREVVALVAPGRGGAGELALDEAAADGAQLEREPDVEDGEDEERDEEDEDAVEDVLVDDAVRLAELERGVVGDGARPAGGDARDEPHLEEARDAVDDDGGGDDDRLDADGAQRAERRRLERAADGDVAVGGDQHRAPDGPHLRDVDERPDVGDDVRREGGVRAPADEDDRRRDLREGGRNEEDVVDDGDDLEEEVGGAAVPLADVARLPLHDEEGERVADEAEGAQHAEDDDVDDEREDDVLDEVGARVGGGVRVEQAAHAWLQLGHRDGDDDDDDDDDGSDVSQGGGDDGRDHGHDGG